MATKKKTTQVGDTNFKGDAAMYTGKTVARFGKCFYEIVLIEGVSKGETRVIAQAPCAVPDPTAACAAANDAIDRAVAAPKMPDDNPTETKTRTPAHKNVAPGQTLTKMYRGNEIRVDVTADGFEYDGQMFKSISACAKHITGYGISGPVFFGLADVK